MTSSFDRRRMLGFIGAGGVLGVVPLKAVAAQGDATYLLRALTWDEARAEANWRRKGGPRWVIHSQITMKWGTTEAYSGTADPLPEDVRLKVIAALGAASAYYLDHGLPAPRLPQDADGAFHLFYVDMPASVNGGFGSHAGGGDYSFNDNWQYENNPVVPSGDHIMLNGANLLQPDYPEQGLVTAAHELSHAIDGSIPPSKTWPSKEGEEILWLGEGSTHAIASFALKGIGFDPLATWKSGAWHVGKDVGRRPYDVPLALKPLPTRRPAWVIGRRPADKDNSEADLTRSFWTKNATYLTCSFWRFLFQEEAPVKAVRAPLKPQAVDAPFLPGMEGPRPTRPGDFELFRAFRYTPVTPADEAKVKANPKWVDPGVAMTDRFLRTYPHPVWGATGLYRAFPAFIAHLVEWPDQVGKSRQGFFAHDQWLDSLFMDGVPEREISIGQDIDIELKSIAPLSARALRFVIPPLLDSLTGDYPAVTITVVSLDGPKNAIDNIHIGLRGKVLANSLSQPIRNGNGRVRRWYNINARPLMTNKTGGETVLTIINSPSDVARGRPLRVRVHIALQIATAAGQCSYHPLPATNAQGNQVPLPSSVSPPMGKIVGQQPVSRASQELDITIAQDADLVTLINAATSADLMGLSVERETDEPARDRNAEMARALQAMQLSALPTKKAGLMITLAMPRVEPGMMGSVAGGRVRAEWIDPVYTSYAEYGASTAVSIATDAVQITIGSNTEGTIIGRFAADFDKGSQNSEREFRGRIEGGFSVGIAHDDEQGEGELPEDPTAVLPTDWFVAAARAGIDTAAMKRMMEGAISGAADETGGAAYSDAAATGSDAAGAAILQIQAPSCNFSSEAEMRMALDRYLKQMRNNVPGITPEQLRTMREALLASPETTAIMLCEAGV